MAAETDKYQGYDGPPQQCSHDALLGEDDLDPAVLELLAAMVTGDAVPLILPHADSGQRSETAPSGYKKIIYGE